MQKGSYPRGSLSLKMTIKFECHHSVIFNWEIHVPYFFFPFPLNISFPPFLPQPWKCDRGSRLWQLHPSLGAEWLHHLSWAVGSEWEGDEPVVQLGNGCALSQDQSATCTSLTSTQYLLTSKWDFSSLRLAKKSLKGWNVYCLKVKKPKSKSNL